jgi:alpha-D-ribose 1-methylphosphonate 5-triphosphate synthase subunit PhnH
MRHNVPPAPPPVPGLFPATAALCRALVTAGRSLWIDQPERSLIHQWVRQRRAARLIPHPETADFTLVTTPSRMPSLYHLNIGDGANPATATTLLIQLADLNALEKLLWNPVGAGSASPDETPELPPTFWQQREELQEMLPWGIDIFFIHGCSFVALPRRVALPTALPA